MIPRKTIFLEFISLLSDILSFSHRHARHWVVTALSCCYRAGLIFVHHFLSKKENVHLLSSSLPCFDKCPETSRIFPRTEQTFASAGSRHVKSRFPSRGIRDFSSPESRGKFGHGIFGIFGTNLAAKIQTNCVKLLKNHLGDIAF